MPLSKSKTEEIEIESLLPTNDYIFKSLFGRKGSEKLTENLIRNFIGIEDIEVEEVIENKILEKSFYYDKFAILDVQAKTKNNEYINIEMQCGNYKYIKDRLVFYLCKSFSTETIKAGEDYGKVRRTVAVLICKDKLDVLKDIPNWRTRWHIREDEYSFKVLTEKLEIVIIELEKITKKTYSGEIEKYSKEAVWCKFFLNPKELGEMEMSKNKDVEEVKTVYDDLIDDYDLAWAAIRRQMSRMDEASLRAEGIEEGIEEGLAKGRKEGIEQGQKESQIKIAKKMLHKGKSIEEIIEFTELTREEIEKLI